MTPTQAYEYALNHYGSRAAMRNRVNVSWKKGTVYNQNDQARLLVDRSFCTGAAVANAYEGQTGKLLSPIKLYGEAKEKAKAEGKDDSREGIPVSRVLELACEKYGGEYHRIRSFYEVLSFIAVLGPVVVSMKWSAGMELPAGRGGWWSRTFGPRWVKDTGPIYMSDGRVASHALVILGASYKHGGCFRLEESKGIGHGNKGTVLMAMDDFQKMLNEDRARAWGPDFLAAQREPSK